MSKQWTETRKFWIILVIGWLFPAEAGALEWLSDAAK